MGTLFMKVESTTASTVKMNKLCLIFLGVLAIAAIVSAVDNEEDSSLSEELASSRLVRSADARRRKGRKGRKGKQGRGRERQTGTVSDACYETTVNIMKMWKDVIANFEKQSKRIEKQNGTGESKSGKKGEFKAHAFKLITAGGGNKSALSCAGVTNNTGAAQMKNLTDFLDSCEDAIHVACNATNFDSIINTTKLMACKEVAETFKTGAEECMGKTVGAGKTSTADACACWTNTSLDATVQAAKDCKFSDEAKAVAAALKTCRNKFAECRRYEDAVADSIAACSTSSDALKKEVAALSQNAAKVKEAQAVVKALAASRQAGAITSATTCTQVQTVAVQLTTLVLEFPKSPQILVFSAAIIASSTVVCTDAEKVILGDVDMMFEEATSHLDSALESAQEQLSTLTGVTA